MAASPPNRSASGSAPGVAPIRDLARAGAYLEGLIDLERLPDFPRERLNLAPIRRLLDRLGHPERELSVLHVAGSKGKGSISLFAESLLGASGERVGTFTSPHLESWTERFRIAGREVEGDALARAVDELRPHVDALRGDAKTAPSFFDATTAVGILLFRDALVDHAILEVGLGGRLDSTNAIQSVVTCISSIELEHTDKLGNTVAEIAGEKAGILKPGVPCVMGRLPRAATEVVRARARSLDAPLFELGRDFDLQRSDGSQKPKASQQPGASQGPGRAAGFPPIEVSFEACDGFAASGKIAVLGEHQIANAALAIAAVRLLRRAGVGPGAVARADERDRETAAAVSRGLQDTRLPGRIELLEREPWVLVDSAHTAASAQALAAAVDHFPARARHLVLSISAGKDLTAILAALVPGASRITVTRAEPTRSLAVDDLAAAIRACAPACDLRVVPDPHRAVRAARESLALDELLCVTGSVYLAGIARGVLRTHDVRGAGS